MLDYARQVMDEKRLNPGKDIATTLVHAEIDGDRLTPDEFCLVLPSAG